MYYFKLTLSEREPKEGGIVGLEASTSLQEIAQHLALLRERVNHVLLMVRDRCLEEERKVRQHWS